MKKVIKFYRENGFRTTIFKILSKISRYSKQQEQIDTLFYFLNHIVDISSLPPTKDQALRKMQLCDVFLLSIFDKVCQKHNLIYWLDFGTLLGAVRHKGFIPWDDDMDVSMPREDYEKAIYILKKDLSVYDIDVNESNGRIGIGYKHHQTGVWLDVFSVDKYHTNKELFQVEKEVTSKAMKYRKYYLRNHASISKEELTKQREKIMGEMIGDEKNNTIVYHSTEFNHGTRCIMHNKIDIYPLQRITFENYDYFAPANLDVYLERIYGNYMQFPLCGVEHHDMGRGKLSSWAERNNIDIDEIHRELEHIMYEYSKN